MKNRWLKPGVCFALILALLSGCAGRTGRARDGREAEDEEESETVEKKETSRKRSASPGVVTGGTPEEIIEIFLDALKEQDAETMLACFYLEELTERYSFPKYVDRLETFIPLTFMGPVNSQFYRELALSERKGELAKQIRFFTWSILLAGDEEWGDDYGGVDFSRPKTGVDDDWAEEFGDKTDPERLGRVRVLSIDENNPEIQRGKSYQDVSSKNCRIYGVDDWCERAALFDCGGDLFCKGFTLVEFDGQWQIFQLNAALLGESAYGIALPLESEDAYWDMIE